jgi:hypothetical protein
MRVLLCRFPGWVVVLLWLPLCGCAVGNTHRYDDVIADLPCSGSGKVAVATCDRRPYVLDGDKGGQFVGLSRGGFGNAFGVTTASGKPLAEDITAVLARALDAKGFDGVPVLLTVGEDDAAVAAKLQATGAPRAVVLVLREWKSDTYVSTALYYDVTLQVRSAAGEVLAEVVQDGKDDLGSSAWNPPSHARSAVPPAFKAKLEALFAEPAVAAAMR